MNRILFKRFLVFLTVILTVAVMTFALTACSFATTDGSKDNTSNVTDDDKDNTGEVTDDGNGDVDAGGNEGGNDEGGADGDETTPEEPENPEEPVEPADPEEPEPEPEPEPTPEPEEPDPEDPEEDTAPADITEVETIDELLLFADEATAILNENYLDGLALKVLGKGMTADDFKNATFEWMIVDYEDNMIKELQVKIHFDWGTTRFSVGKVLFNQSYTINQIVNGEATDVVYSDKYRGPGISETTRIENQELGNLVINVVNGTDTTTQNEGDIWCSIGSLWAESGKEYRTIKVYQINENQVQKYELIVEAPTIKVDEIIQNINDNKLHSSTPTCETMYTFTGIVIE